MKREEEILRASVSYNFEHGMQMVIGGDNMISEEEHLIFNKNPHFIAGAEWADKTMIEKVFAEIKRLREKDYPTDTFEEAVGYYSALDDIESFLKEEQ